MQEAAKKEVIQQLRENISIWEGFKQQQITEEKIDFGLHRLESAFPSSTFPLGTVHEFISPNAASAVASNGFISGILRTLMRDGMYCLWVSTKRNLFPPALAHFGVPPHQVIFVDVRRDKDALWVMEQGLQCAALAAVVAELSEITFAQSQRLQLAVEKSRVTGFVHRRRPQRTTPLACVSRWRIRPVASHNPDQLPGVGFPIWQVHLEKIRNGRPGKWHIGWQNGSFIAPQHQQAIQKPKTTQERYA